MAKAKPKKVLICGLGPHECVECKTPAPTGPLTYLWRVHLKESEEYEKGYWMPLTCSDECRIKGGYECSSR